MGGSDVRESPSFLSTKVPSFSKMIPPQSLLDVQSLIKSEDDLVKLEIAETEAYLLGKGAGPNGYNPYNPSPVPLGLSGYAPPLAQRPLRAQQDRGASSSLCIPVSQSSSAQNGQEDVKMDPVQRISGVSDSDTEYGSIKREKGGLYWSCHQCGQKGMTPKQLREHVRTSHWVPCLSCGTYCKDAKQLQQHYMRCTASRDWRARSARRSTRHAASSRFTTDAFTRVTRSTGAMCATTPRDPSTAAGPQAQALGREAAALRSLRQGIRGPE